MLHQETRCKQLSDSGGTTFSTNDVTAFENYEQDVKPEKTSCSEVAVKQKQHPRAAEDHFSSDRNQVKLFSTRLLLRTLGFSVEYLIS